MTEATTLDLVRFAWLTLATMMLASRVAFHAGGPVAMRMFLDTWKSSSTKRIWGAVSLLTGLVLGAAAVFAYDDPSAMDLVVTVALLVVLAADGAVNVLPAGFETFKDRVQERWVTRTGGGGAAGDARLFAVGNLVLALAAIGAAAVVALYRSLDAGVLIGAVATGLALTAVLIRAARAEAQP